MTKSTLQSINLYALLHNEIVDPAISAINQGILHGRIIAEGYHVECLEDVFQALEKHQDYLFYEIRPVWHALANKGVPVKEREKHPEYIAVKGEYDAAAATMQFILNIPVYSPKGERIYINP